MATLVLSPAAIDESGARQHSDRHRHRADLTLSVTLSDNAVLDAGETETRHGGTEDNDVDGADLEVAVSATASGGRRRQPADPLTVTVEG